MALTARLQFGDNSTKTYPKEFLVENCRCHFSRHYDLAYPDTDARCERVELTVVAPGKDDLTLYDWYINGEPMLFLHHQSKQFTNQPSASSPSNRPTASR